MARQRLIREELPLPDDAVLVRALSNAADGAAFDRDELIVDATRNLELFGYYGLSLWAVSDEWPVDRVFAEKARKAARCALFTAGSLRDKGLGIVPSGRAPHHDTTVGGVYGRRFGAVQVTASGAEDLAARLMSAAYTVVKNQHHIEDLD